MNKNEEKTLDMLDEEEFELILDPVEDKEFIEEMGLAGDRVPGLDEDFVDSESDE